MSEWGNPLTWNGEHPHMNQIVCGGNTRGSEPSKYPQEKKSNEIPPVAASERGGAQTARVTACAGLKDRDTARNAASRTRWKARP